MSAILAANCSRYQNYSCNACHSTSLNNKNTFLIKTFEIDTAVDSQSAISRLFIGRTDNLVQSVCVAKAVSNCQIFSTYNKCFICNEGYYLKTDFTCGLYTTKGLSGCSFFSDENTCDECFGNYYNNENVCTLRDTIDHCDVYSVASDGCETCVSAYYISNGSCLERQVIVANCLNYDTAAEKCIECPSTHQLVNDGLFCALLENSCAEYEVYDVAGTNTKCDRCVSGYYLLNGACNQGTKDNCSTYENGQDVCVKCASNYALDGDKVCQQITTEVESCEDYISDLPARCETCSKDTFLIIQFYLCTPLTTPVLNCKYYSGNSICGGCIDGYELLDNACAIIPESEHCVSKSNGSCNECAENYKFYNGGCAKIPDVYNFNCDENGAQSMISNYECYACSPSYLLIPNINYLCLNDDDQRITKITGCAKYYFDTTDNQYKCKLCDTSYGLSSDSTQCLQTCPDGELMYYGGLEIQASSLSLQYFARCVDINQFMDLPNGCGVASHNLKSSGNVCLKCKADYIPIETCPMNNTFFNIDNLEDIKEGQAFSTVSCEAKPDAATFYPTSESPKAECKHYRPDGGKYYCSQCAFGITGVIAEDDSGKPYIDCSTDVTGCNKDAVLGSGFVDDSWLNDMYGFSLSFNFTCHVCTDPNQIPFIHMSNRGQLNAYQLNDSDDIPSSTTTKDGEMTVCREPTAAGLNVDASKFTAFVSNCALGLIVTDITKNVTTTASSARCLACKDGYKKVLDASGFYIESCKAIANCSSNPQSGWLDGCKTCESTYVKKIDSENKIDPNDCSTSVSAVASANCRIYSDTDSKCAVCERGYYRDLDGNCILLEFTACPGYAHNFDLYDQIKSVHYKQGSIVTSNYSYAYQAGATTFDCYKCSEGYFSVVDSNPRSTCAKYNDIDTATGEYLIDNCSGYGLYLDKESIVCRKCATDFIISDNSLKCSSQSEFPNCFVTDNDATICYGCNNGYVKNSGACVESPDPHCENYDSNNGVLSCMGCISGYYVDNGDCVKGPDDNCSHYQNATTCGECKTGYYLLHNFCIPIPGSFNCSSGTIGINGPNRFECDTCNDNYFRVSPGNISDYTFCMPGYDENCLFYDWLFECEACKTG